MSMIATASLLFYLAWKNLSGWYRSFRYGDANSVASRRGSQISVGPFTELGYFWLVNLFISGRKKNIWCFSNNLDLIQSIGWTLVAYHLHKNAVLPGLACTVQGILINSGDVASAVWAFVIAIHTTMLFVGGPKWGDRAVNLSVRGKARWFICLGVWSGVLFIGFIGMGVSQTPEKGPFCMSLSQLLLNVCR